MKEGQAMEPIPYTLARAYRDIRAGAPPWVALNEFLHEWFESAGDRREHLVHEPITTAPASHDPGAARDAASWRWAVFCAAAADWLCAQDRVARPAWADDPAYTLAAPWYGFDAPGAAKPQVRERLERTTPEPFRRRNIVCGDRVFATKYGFARAHVAPRRLPEEAPTPPSAAR